jgi:ribosomal protein S18 acetylase RimI-like enzyme
MYRVRTASPADLPGVIELIARLQVDPAHHIAFHGESPAEVAEELAALGGDWASLAVVAADQNGRLRGVLSVEVAAAGRRAFLYGPYVDVPANHPAAGQLWRRTADALFAAAMRLPTTAGVSELDLFGHRNNRLLADFAARHDIPVGNTSRLFTLTDTGLRTLLVRPAGEPPRPHDRVALLPDDPAARDAVARLHDRCFPNAPTPGDRLVSGADGHTVVVLLGNELLGYAAGYAQAEEYYVDVVGVDPMVRGLGAGRLLVRRLLLELADGAGARNRAAAMVNLGNDASEHMFTALGFTCSTELVSYRRSGFRAKVGQP